MIQSFLFNCGLGSANFIFFFFFKNNSIYLFLAVLGRRCGEGFSLVAASEDDSLVAVLGFSRRRSQALGTWVSVVVAPELQSTESVVVAHRLCSSNGMWDLSRSGTEPLSLASAGGFFTTQPPGKHPPLFFLATLCDIQNLSSPTRD